MKPLLLLLDRGLQGLGKTIALLTALALVAVLVGGPVIVILTLVIIATVYVAPLVGDGAWTKAMLFFAFMWAFFFFAGVYVAPHVGIGKAVGALFDPQDEQSPE
jgi:hypothetical protein